jgi:hypothetical protein
MGDDGPFTPPMVILWVAAGVVALSALLLPLSGKVVNLLGYILATLVASILVGQFRAIDGRRRSRPTYVVPRSAQFVAPVKLATTILLIGYLIGAVHVWTLADAVARS